MDAAYKFPGDNRVSLFCIICIVHIVPLIGRGEWMDRGGGAKKRRNKVRKGEESGTEGEM